MMMNKKISFIAGLTCGLSFAPTYFFPGIFCISVLCAQIVKADSLKASCQYGYFFGFGFFLSSLYWMPFGLLVYIDDFLWIFPFAIIGLPAALALFPALILSTAWYLKQSSYYHLAFCILWTFMEWLMSWIFTGLPWSMLGYTLTFSEEIIQISSITGVLGISFIMVFIGSVFFSKNLLVFRVIISIALLVSGFLYGKYRLNANPTQFSPLQIRIVQPSIPQVSKWSPELFRANLDAQIKLSSQPPGNQNSVPDVIVWSEAALTVPFNYKYVYDKVMQVFTKDPQLLVSGGISDNGSGGEDYQLYSSLIGINSRGELLFDYHKSHLVPFGEYMPLKKYLPLKKITHGLVDYTPGLRVPVFAAEFNLNIHPLICYESIFYHEVRVDNKDVDVIINVTNDAWYGKSSGPFQHFQISRMRVIENGLPMIRSANNGISAIIDPLGRVIKRLELDEVGVIDEFLPYKLMETTIYSSLGEQVILLLIFILWILQSICVIIYTKYFRKKVFS